MKVQYSDIKKLKLELNKMVDESNQICRILDKDDVNVEYINQIGKKTFLKTPNARKKNILPNLIYYQGQINDNEYLLPNDFKKTSMNFKGIFSSSNNNDQNMNLKNKTQNDFHADFFRNMKGVDNDKVINTMLISKNFSKHKKKKFNEEEKKYRIKMIMPEILERKNRITKKLPIYIKKYKKNYNYANNQLIMDEINGKRYAKYDDPFLYSLNIFPSNQVLPNYEKLLFKYEKAKIRDYFYRHTVDNFHKKKSNLEIAKKNENENINTNKNLKKNKPNKSNKSNKSPKDKVVYI